MESNIKKDTLKGKIGSVHYSWPSMIVEGLGPHPLQATFVFREINNHKASPALSYPELRFSSCLSQ